VGVTRKLRRVGRGIVTKLADWLVTVFCFDSGIHCGRISGKSPLRSFSDFSRRNPDPEPWQNLTWNSEASMDTDVLVVGAGPTGLMLANQLVRRGVRTLVIDRHAGPSLERRHR